MRSNHWAEISERLRRIHQKFQTEALPKFEHIDKNEAALLCHKKAQKALADFELFVPLRG
ncbi:MAG TPA: hypothetical protein VKB05_13670 [Pyrinomonadaceae bacterium]|nr:hypothetical protein [Pyrinomonadaceae bacterium]